MKPCTCGANLDNSAKFCPHCGKTFKVTSGCAKSAAVVLGVFTVLVIFLMYVGMSHQPATPILTPAEQVAKQKNEQDFQRAVAAAKQLRAAMRNPSSFKLGQVLIMPDGSVCFEYRAQNGFGGLNVGQAVLSANNQFKSNDSSGFGSLWKKECEGKTGTDKTWQVGYAAGFQGLMEKD